MQATPVYQLAEMLGDERVESILARNGFSLIDFATGSVIVSESWKDAGFDANALAQPIPLQHSVHPDDRHALENLFGRIRSGELENGSGSFRFIATDGSTRWFDLSIEVLIWDPAGQPLSMLIHDTDITRLIIVQEEVRERLLEIESLKDLLFSINKSLDFDETVRRIIEHLHKIIPFDLATVQVLESDGLHVVAGFGYSMNLVENLVFPVRGTDNPASRAMASRRPMICNDVQQDFEGFIQPDKSIVVRSWLGIPLVYEGRAIGLFALDSASEGIYNNNHVRVASNIAEHLAIALEHARQHTMIKSEARTDTLTGAANRYGLETEGQEIFIRSVREDTSLGVLMIDIDLFKNLNDTFGHAYGDQVLKLIAEGISQSLRAKDYLVRYGGEEFVVLLPGTSTREALVVAERLREKIPRIEVDPTHTCPTVSIGIFSGVPGVQDLLHDFIRRADLALYEAKSSGRNRCRVWSPKPEYFDKQRD